MSTRRARPPSPPRASRLLRVLGARATARAVLLVLLPAQLLGLAARSEADTAERPRFWAGEAAARSLDLSFNMEPGLLPLEEFVRQAVAEGVSSWAPGTATARSSALYPGSSGTSGPRMMCEFGFPCPPGFPPDYPFTAQAQHPTQPDARSQDGLATAHAGTDFVATDVHAPDPVPEPLAAALRAGTTRATTRQEFDAGALVVTAESRVEHLALLDGLVEVRSVVSVSRSLARPGDEPASTTSLVVEGVRVAGQPAEITADGVRVLDRGSPDPATDAARRALADALAAFGADIRLVGTSQETRGESTRGQAAGLLLSFRQPVEGPAVPGVPTTPYRTYVVTAVVGGAGTSAFATDSGFGLPDVPDGRAASTVAVAAPPPRPAAGVGVETVPLSEEPAFAAGVDPPLPAATPPAGTARSTGGAVLRGLDLLGDEAADALALAYLALAATVLLVLAGARAATHRLASTQPIDSRGGNR